jgi:hypothetical protein
MKKQKTDIDVLFRRLRLLAQKKGFVVYNICIRNAGVGIAYARFRVTDPEPNEITVFDYHRGLRGAIVGELKAWEGRT